VNQLLQVACSFTCVPIGPSLRSALQDAGVADGVGFSQYAQMTEYMLGAAADSASIVGTLVMLRVEDWLRDRLKPVLPGTVGDLRPELRAQVDEILGQLTALAGRGKPVWLLACPSRGWIAERHKLTALCLTYTNLLVARARGIKGLTILAWPAITGEVDDRHSDRLGWIPFTQEAYDQVGQFVATQVAARLAQGNPEATQANPGESPGLAAYLKGLNVNVKLVPADAANRADIDKTLRTAASFTLTGEKRDIRDSEIDALLDSGGCMVITVSDRLSDHGPSGVITFRAKGDTLIVESLALSCAVMGKQVEYAVLSGLAKIASERNLKNLVFEYSPTERNQPMLSFLRSIAVGETETRYVLPAAAAEARVTSAAVSAGAWSLNVDSRSAKDLSDSVQEGQPL
jgi:hypothetical protein